MILILVQAVSTWAKTGNAKFRQALDDPLYVRVRDALVSDKKLSIDLEQKTSLGDAPEVNGLEGDSGSIDTCKH